MICWRLRYNNYWMCLLAQQFQPCLTFYNPMGCNPPRLLCPWDSPGKNAGVGCHFLLQRIFLAMASNPCLLHLLNWQAGSLTLASPGKPSVIIIYTYTHCFLLKQIFNIIQKPFLILKMILRSTKCILKNKENLSPILFMNNFVSTIYWVFVYTKHFNSARR